MKTSNLASVSMDATNPAVANQMLQNYLDLYLESNLEKRRKESLEASGWLKVELAKVEKQLMESQAELVGFLIDHGISVSSTETGVSPVMDLLNKSMETHTKSREARLHIQALKGQKSSELGAVMPKDVNTDYVGKLKEQVALFESEYSQMKGLYSAEYPKMEMLSQKIKFLKERISEIEKSIVASALDTAQKEESLFKGSVPAGQRRSQSSEGLGCATPGPEERRGNQRGIPQDYLKGIQGKRHQGENHKQQCQDRRSAEQTAQASLAKEKSVFSYRELAGSGRRNRRGLRCGKVG